MTPFQAREQINKVVDSCFQKSNGDMELTMERARRRLRKSADYNTIASILCDEAIRRRTHDLRRRNNTEELSGLYALVYGGMQLACITKLDLEKFEVCASTQAEWFQTMSAFFRALRQRMPKGKTVRQCFTEQELHEIYTNLLTK